MLTLKDKFLGCIACTWIGSAMGALAKNKQTGVWFFAFDIKPTGETRNVLQEVRVDADQGVVLSVDEVWRR